MNLPQPILTERRPLPRGLMVVLAAALIMSAGVVFRFVDDLGALWWLPRCVFHELTGLLCPGCGATRALHALAHGQLLRALSCNALLVGLVLALPAWLLAGSALSSRIQARIAWLIAGAFIVFFVIRNLPLGLAPPM